MIWYLIYFAIAIAYYIATDAAIKTYENDSEMIQIRNLVNPVILEIVKIMMALFWPLSLLMVIFNNR